MSDVFTFRVDQYVNIVGIASTGRIENLLLQRNGATSALVHYFDKEDRLRREWFPEGVLTAVA